MKVKIIRIGNSRGIIIPGHLLKKMNLSEGDTLYLNVVDNPPGLILKLPETEMEQIGVKREDRSEIEQFLSIYGHIIRGLR